MAEAIAAELKVAPSTVLHLGDAALYKAVCGEVALLIAGRMHPAILAAPMGTPMLALAYNPKFEGLLALLGRENHVLPVSELVCRGDAAGLAERALQAWEAGPVDRDRTVALEQRFAAFNGELAAMLVPGDTALPVPPIPR